MAAFALLKALTDLGYGIVSSPEAFVMGIMDFVQDPLNPVKIPILGPLGEALGVTTAMALEDPNAVTISQAVGAYAEAFLLVAGARTGAPQRAGSMQPQLRTFLLSGVSWRGRWLRLKRDFDRLKRLSRVIMSFHGMSERVSWNIA